MNKKLYFAFLLCFLAFGAFSQKDLNFFYRDTIMEVEGMKLEIKQSFSNLDQLKYICTFTNLTDNFKVIKPEDIVCYTVDNKVITNATAHKKMYVIPPKTSRKLRLYFKEKEANFRGNIMNLAFNAVYTTGPVEAVYELGDLEVSLESLEAIKKKDAEIGYEVGPVKVMLSNLAYDEDRINVKVKIFYSGNKFLGINFPKFKLKEADGVTYVNMYKKEAYFHFQPENKYQNHTLVFENPTGEKNVKNRKDYLNFKDVFTEYSLNKNDKPFVFQLYKFGEGKGGPPKQDEDKGDDLEVVD